MNYVYSASNNAFYPIELKSNYKEFGAWPSDAIVVVEDVFREYSEQPPEGKIRVGNSDGLPCWDDIPPPTKDELVARAESEKATKIVEANQVTQAWQTQLMLGIINAKDKELLIKWMKYIQALQAIDTSAHSEIEWPQKP